MATTKIQLAKHEDVTNHTSNTTNPHGVTKAQVGLGNVLNVASYSKTEVDGFIQDIENSIPEVPVQSVNNKTGAITLNAGDVGAYTKDEADEAIELSAIISNESTTTEKVGGIAKGTSLKGKSVKDVLESMLFAYVSFGNPSVSSTPGASSIVEKGTSKTVTAIKCTYTAGSKSLTSAKLYKNDTLQETKTSGLTSGFSFTRNDSITTATTYKIEITDGTTTKNASCKPFTFIDPFFYGILDSNSSPASATITSKTKDIVSTGDKTYSYTCTNKFPFIAYPSSYGTLTSVLDGNGFENLTDFTKYTVTLSVTSGNVSYYIYIKNSAATINNFSYTFKGC